jgi:hypothetical protein
MAVRPLVARNKWLCNECVTVAVISQAGGFIRHSTCGGTFRAPDAPRLKCDICSAALYESQGTVVPLVEMQTIARNGFTPFRSGLAPTNITGAAQSLGVQLDQMDKDWQQKVLKDKMPWLLCTGCHNKTRPFVGKQRSQAEASNEHTSTQTPALVKTLGHDMEQFLIRDANKNGAALFTLKPTESTKRLKKRGLFSRIFGDKQPPSGSQTIPMQNRGAGEYPPVPRHSQQQAQITLASLGLPRTGTTLRERVLETHVKFMDGKQFGNFHIILNWQDYARQQPPNSPLFFSWEGRATAIVRLDAMSHQQVHQLQAAIKQGKILLTLVLALCPTFPVLGLRFIIDPANSDGITIEGPRDIRLADVQTFLNLMLDARQGDIHIYWGADAEFGVIGRFVLCMNLPQATLPYKPTNTDVEILWGLLQRASTHLNTIPGERQDFTVAVQYYLDNTSV